MPSEVVSILATNAVPSLIHFRLCYYMYVTLAACTTVRDNVGHHTYRRQSDFGKPSVERMKEGQQPSAKFGNAKDLLEPAWIE